MKKEVIDALVTFRAISMLMYNFNYSTDIAPLKAKHHGFAHGWDKIWADAKAKGYSFTIPHELIYEHFCNWDHNSQSVFVERALEKYGEEARKGLQSAIVLSAMADAHFEKEKNKNNH